MTESNCRPDLAQEAIRERFLPSRLEPRWLTGPAAECLEGVPGPAVAARPAAGYRAAGRMAADRYSPLPPATKFPLPGHASRKNGGGPTSAGSMARFPLPNRRSRLQAARRCRRYAAADRRRRSGGPHVGRRQSPVPKPARPGSGCAGRALRQPGRVGPAARRADRAVLVHPRRRSAVRQVLRVARGLLVGRDDALRAQGRGDRPAAAHVFGPVGRAERFRPRPDRPGRRRRGHGAGRDRQQRSGGRRLALRRGGDPRRPGRPVALRELAELGQRRLALRPSQGPGRPRCLAAMDHRRLGQPPGQSESARGPGRRRGPCPGERRDVHRRHAAPLLSHAPAPRGRRTAPATCSTRARCRANRGSSGGA